MARPPSDPWRRILPNHVKFRETLETILPKLDGDGPLDEADRGLLAALVKHFLSIDQATRRDVKALWETIRDEPLIAPASKKLLRLQTRRFELAGDKERTDIIQTLERALVRRPTEGRDELDSDSPVMKVGGVTIRRPPPLRLARPASRSGD